MALGIDIVLHSATKYWGGHSDISAGVVVSSKSVMQSVINSARNYGGNLSEMMVWLLERSIKTLALRVRAQNENALQMAQFLDQHPLVTAVHYQGLKTIPIIY